MTRAYWNEERDPFSFSPNWIEPPLFELRLNPAQLVLTFAATGLLMAAMFSVGAVMGWSAARTLYQRDAG